MTYLIIDDSQRGHHNEGEICTHSTCGSYMTGIEATYFLLERYSINQFPQRKVKVASTPPVGKGSSIYETQVTKTINSTVTSPDMTVVTVVATDPTSVVDKYAL